jgi:hypothetical protein
MAQINNITITGQDTDTRIGEVTNGDLVLTTDKGGK